MVKSVLKTLLENSAYDEDTKTLFTTAPGISFSGLKALAKKHNFTVGSTQSGEYVAVPTSFKYDNEDVSLYDNFLDTYTHYDTNYGTLLTVYKTVDLMTENLAEVDLILNTYVAEVLGQGFIDNPLDITISNKKAQDLIQRVFYKNKIYDKLPIITYNLAKYGNYGFALCYPYLEKWMTDEQADRFHRIDVLEDLTIAFVNPQYFRVNTDEYYNPINYVTTLPNTFVSDTKSSVLNNKIWQPWQFSHFLLASDITEPYGKSMLWSMRSAFDQLSTLESLLGISRASMIQRIVFYVPLPAGLNVVDSYGYMNEFRSNYLNTLFTDTQGVKAGRKIPGALSILTLPESADGKKVSFETIQNTNQGLLETDDVDYFLEKILRASGLPKGYLVGDETITTAQALSAQDLKLKRTLLPLKKGLLNGILSLTENVLTHAGYDIDNLEIEVSLREPVQISADTIEKYSNLIDIVGKFRELNPKMTNINSFQALIKMGMPIELSSLICSTNSINELSDKTDLAKFLKGQKLKNNNGPENPESDVDMGESVVGCRVSSRTFLKENYELHKTLKKVYQQIKENTSDVMKLNESIFCQKKVFTE